MSKSNQSVLIAVLNVSIMSSMSASSFAQDSVQFWKVPPIATLNGMVDPDGTVNYVGGKWIFSTPQSSTRDLFVTTAKPFQNSSLGAYCQMIAMFQSNGLHWNTPVLTPSTTAGPLGSMAFYCAQVDTQNARVTAGRYNTSSQIEGVSLGQASKLANSSYNGNDSFGAMVWQNISQSGPQFKHSGFSGSAPSLTLPPPPVTPSPATRPATTSDRAFVHSERLGLSVFAESHTSTQTTASGYAFDHLVPNGPYLVALDGNGNTVWRQSLLSNTFPGFPAGTKRVDVQAMALDTPTDTLYTLANVYTLLPAGGTQRNLIMVVTDITLGSRVYQYTIPNTPTTVDFYPTTNSEAVLIVGNFSPAIGKEAFVSVSRSAPVGAPTHARLILNRVQVLEDHTVSGLVQPLPLNSNVAAGDLDQDGFDDVIWLNEITYSLNALSVRNGSMLISNRDLSGVLGSTYGQVTSGLAVANLKKSAITAGEKPGIVLVSRRTIAPAMWWIPGPWQVEYKLFAFDNVGNLFAGYPVTGTTSEPANSGEAPVAAMNRSIPAPYLRSEPGSSGGRTQATYAFGKSVANFSVGAPLRLACWPQDRGTQGNTWEVQSCVSTPAPESTPSVPSSGSRPRRDDRRDEIQKPTSDQLDSRSSSGSVDIVESVTVTK